MYNVSIDFYKFVASHNYNFIGLNSSNTQKAIFLETGNYLPN